MRKNKNTQEQSSMKHIGKLVYRMTSETTEKEEKVHKYIPLVVIILNAVISPIIGLLMAVRGNYDGKISLIGLSMRIFYFISFIFVTYFDSRFERGERYARMIPRIFGILLATVQLFGIARYYDCDSQYIITCI